MSVEILDLAALALTAVFFALLYYLHKKKHVDFGVRTILAVGLGLIVGLAFKGHHVYVAAVGTVYAHVVSAVVIPLLVFSIISSITNLGNSVRLKNIGLKTVFFLVLNTFFASLITLVAGVATNIGVTGILQNIPGELYEAAKIDGANAVQIFFKITLPYMLFVMTPYLITQFTGNINNFNVIYLLSGGNPTPVDATAGKTDLLVTWLYKLTVDKNYYNLGAVIGIMTFIVLAIVALVTYRNTASYKDEEGFM